MRELPQSEVCLDGEEAVAHVMALEWLPQAAKLGFTSQRIENLCNGGDPTTVELAAVQWTEREIRSVTEFFRLLESWDDQRS
jgi:hypothetical protein